MNWKYSSKTSINLSEMEYFEMIRPWTSVPSFRNFAMLAEVGI
jgi:hypothetical protein